MDGRNRRPSRELKTNYSQRCIDAAWDCLPSRRCSWRYQRLSDGMTAQSVWAFLQETRWLIWRNANIQMCQHNPLQMSTPAEQTPLKTDCLVTQPAANSLCKWASLAQQRWWASSVTIRDSFSDIVKHIFIIKHNCCQWEVGRTTGSHSSVAFWSKYSRLRLAD